MKAKIRTLTRRTSQPPLGATLKRINQILRGCTTYFRHTVAKHTFDFLCKLIYVVADRALTTTQPPSEMGLHAAPAHQPHRTMAPPSTRTGSSYSIPR
ncbi:group II intron maturase-specific domain-containing protein [Mycobacterium lepromatosis]|uniref:group II intron maturase-specific domain-containing protein n=1 Tax=Mycobacterium lepromatosis TaxID=480418 RepID=UPI0009E22824